MLNDERLPTRFWEKVAVNPSGCWVWIGARTSSGYGNFKFRGRYRGAHRVAYEVLIGMPKLGMELDHLCRNRACCNPSHLEPVTGTVNLLRGISPTAINARKTHCHRGHELTAENTYVYGSHRKCKTCQRINDSRRIWIPRRERATR
jgi:hypothetical protein